MTWMLSLSSVGPSSLSRWAMEIMTINELDFYQDNMRNSIIMIFKGLGKGLICYEFVYLEVII